MDHLELKQYLEDKIAKDKKRENSWAGDDYLFGVNGNDEYVGLFLVDTSEIEEDEKNSLFFQIIEDFEGKHYKAEYSRAGTYRAGYSYTLLDVFPVVSKEVITHEWVSTLKKEEAKAKEKISPVLAATYERQVIDDKAALDEKAEKLSNFIANSQTFGRLDTEEQERLREQNDLMWSYSEVLGRRIAAFCN